MTIFSNSIPKNANLWSSPGKGSIQSILHNCFWMAVPLTKSAPSSIRESSAVICLGHPTSQPSIKARKVIGLLYRRFYSILNTDTLIQLYVLLVRPHLEYEYSVWAPASRKDIDSLKGLQKFAFWMANHNWSLNYQELLSLMDLPTLESRRLQLKFGHLFKIVHGLCFFLSGIVPLREQTHHSCRSIHPLTLQQPFAHTQAYSQSFIPHTCSLEFSTLWSCFSTFICLLNIHCIQNKLLLIFLCHFYCH